MAVSVFPTPVGQAMYMVAIGHFLGARLCIREVIIDAISSVDLPCPMIRDLSRLRSSASIGNSTVLSSGRMIFPQFSGWLITSLLDSISCNI